MNIIIITPYPDLRNLTTNDFVCGLVRIAAMFSLRDDANLREFVLENVEHF